MALATTAQDAAWLRIGYWEGLVAREQSVADGARFFLSPQGKQSAEKELEATKQAFLHESVNVAAEDVSIACRFPARFLLLAKELGLDPELPLQRCPRYKKWTEQLNAKSLTLLFASAFMNSPSSMYGHTLLRLGRGGQTEGQVLLDNVVAYGADTGGTAGPLYLIYGLTGGFPGTFTTAPFYLKVHEYSNAENRDFWEYDLKVTTEEMRLLVAHLWELKQASFAYYFFNRNCSYYVLRLLEAIKPNINLTQSFGASVIPVDTIRVLQEQGLVLRKVVRPSRWRRVAARRALLSQEQRSIAKALGSGEELALPPDNKQQAKILDAAYEYFRFRSAITNVLTPEQKQTEQRLLSKRAPLGIAEAEIAVTEHPPEEGHHSQRWRLGLGLFRNLHAENTQFAEFHYRPAYHDLQQESAGYESASELVMADLRGRWDKKPARFYLERVDLLRLRSVPAWDAWNKKVSWQLVVGSRRAKDFACLGWACTLGRAEGGAGISMGTLTIFANMGLELGAPLQRGFRVGAGPAALWRFAWSDYFKTALEAKRLYAFWGEDVPWWELGIVQSIVWGRSEIHMEWVRARRFDEASLSFGRSF